MFQILLKSTKANLKFFFKRKKNYFKKAMKNHVL
jgi:hypothetical protein